MTHFNMDMPTEKIEEIINKIDEYNEKISFIKTSYVDKINQYLSDLEHILNNAASYSVQWVEKKVKVLTDKIKALINTMIKKIQCIVDDLKKWAQRAFDNIAANTIRSTMGKIGVELSKDEALAMKDMLPLKVPSFDALVPEIELELDIPDVSSLPNSTEIKIPRINL